MIYKTKVLIIGSGSAGCTAAIYAARSNLQPILIAGMQPGGQLTITTDVENYPGFADVIQGPWLMEQMQLQAKNSGATLVIDEIKHIEREDNSLFKCSSMLGNTYVAQSIIAATGAQANWLGLESEENFKGYGVSACATCDGTFFKNQCVAVIGGGNTAVEEALYLTRHAAKVILIHRRDKLRAEAVLVKRLMSNDKIQILWNTTLNEIIGETSPNKKVTSIVVNSLLENTTYPLKVDGVFIAIGHSPNTKLFEKLVKLDESGYIITNSGSTKTSLEGIFAAGDVQDKVYRQAVVAAGSGCMAALDAESFLAK